MTRLWLDGSRTIYLLVLRLLQDSHTPLAWSEVPAPTQARCVSNWVICVTKSWSPLAPLAMSAPSASTVALRGRATARAARFIELGHHYWHAIPMSVVDRAPDNLYLLVVARRHDNDSAKASAIGPEAIAIA